MKHKTKLFLLFLVLATATISAQNTTNEDCVEVGTLKVNESLNNINSQPEFPGGNRELAKYLTKNIRYPRNSRSSSSRGKVIVCFKIEKDGKISDVQIVKGVNKILNKEAKRVVSKMPNWKPAVENGIAITSKRNMPIVFFRN
jgi:TonB family protein